MKQLLLLTLISTVFLISSCSKGNGELHTVKYNILSSSTMNVTYTNEKGSLESANNVNSSWTYSFKNAKRGKVVKLIINSTSGDSVGGSIEIDGQQSTQDNSQTGSVTLSVKIE